MNKGDKLTFVVKDSFKGYKKTITVKGDVV